MPYTYTEWDGNALSFQTSADVDVNVATIAAINSDFTTYLSSLPHVEKRNSIDQAIKNSVNNYAAMLLVRNTFVQSGGVDTQSYDFPVHFATSMVSSSGYSPSAYVGVATTSLNFYSDAPPGLSVDFSHSSKMFDVKFYPATGDKFVFTVPDGYENATATFTIYLVNSVSSSGPYTAPTDASLVIDMVSGNSPTAISVNDLGYVTSSTGSVIHVTTSFNLTFNGSFVAKSFTASLTIPEALSTTLTGHSIWATSKATLELTNNNLTSEQYNAGPPSKWFSNEVTPDSVYTFQSVDISGGTIDGTAITGLADPTHDADAASKSYVDTSFLSVDISGGTIDGTAITGLADPTADADAANKSYVDTAIAGISAGGFGTVQHIVNVQDGEDDVFGASGLPKYTASSDGYVVILMEIGNGTAGSWSTHWKKDVFVTLALYTSASSTSSGRGLVSGTLVAATKLISKDKYEAGPMQTLSFPIKDTHTFRLYRIDSGNEASEDNGNDFKMRFSIDFTPVGVGSLTES